VPPSAAPWRSPEVERAWLKSCPARRIAKFEIAFKKCPHFAEPLEIWGEALVLKNRSDFALAKFEEANKYAPHWGRLHLK
jgi:hypothetical protein